MLVFYQLSNRTCGKGMEESLHTKFTNGLFFFFAFFFCFFFTSENWGFMNFSCLKSLTPIHLEERRAAVIKVLKKVKVKDLCQLCIVSQPQNFCKIFNRKYSNEATIGMVGWSATIKFQMHNLFPLFFLQNGLDLFVVGVAMNDKKKTICFVFQG